MPIRFLPFFGVSIVPTSVQRQKRDDVVYRPIAEAGAASPIILSWRTNDNSSPIAVLLQICAELVPQA
jgi:DNA-binding transcriptional LysR family regulator